MNGAVTVAVVQLVMLTSLTVWLIAGLAGAVRSYVGSGRLAAGDARRMLARGAVGMGAWAAVPLAQWLVRSVAEGWR